jgi:translation initiation factor IF-2
VAAIRIYAFAKDLGLENKDLLDLCERAGIKNKGSALASLTDEEALKIKQLLQSDQGGEATAKKAAVESPVAPRRDDVAPRPTGPVRVLDGRRPRSDGGKETTSTPARPTTPEPRRPAVRVAVMPDVKQPTMDAPAPTEKVQKPDIALPQDAIRDAMRRAKAGAAPLEGFTRTGKAKHEPKKGKQPSRLDGILVTESTKAPPRRRDGRDRDVEEGKAGFGGIRQHRPRPRQELAGLDSESDRPRAQRSAARRRASLAASSAPRKERITLQLPCTVRSFSEAAGVPAARVIKALMDMGMLTNINAELDGDVAQMLADSLGANIELRAAESLEQSLLQRLESPAESTDGLVTRPPVVTFLGHVDHGKTSLLDAIIGINVVAGEAGGITQHIRAYQIQRNGHPISFVDTPGHEAFTEMRARGANVTDIAVLVVAADDGVMPQTEEAISHAKAAKVPIIVALNKIDLPGANPEKVMQELAAHELLPSQWGGDVEVISTSAVTGVGIEQLLGTILVTAELHELKADPNRPALGTCLEAEQHADRGVLAKLIVQSGTLRPGDVIVCGAAQGRVKAMYDTLDLNRTVPAAGPSMPVNVTGLDVAPEAGERFYVLEDIGQAREIALSRQQRSRHQSLSGITTRVSLEEFQARLASGNLVAAEDIVELNLIIRADTRGSIEAIQKELTKIEHPEIKLNILQALVGGITVADVRLAQASGAVIIGFNVVPDDAARTLADEVQVEIRRYDIIYKVADDIKATLEGRLKPEEQTVELGSAMVLRIFSISRIGTIAGCRVMRGHIERGCRIRVIRDSRVIGDYPIDSLKREKDDAREVQRGMECGIKLAGFNDVKEGDTLEAYKIEEVARTL